MQSVQHLVRLLAAPRRASWELSLSFSLSGLLGKVLIRFSRSSVHKVFTSCPKTHVQGPRTCTSRSRFVGGRLRRWGVLPMTAAPARGTVTADQFTKANVRRSRSEERRVGKECRSSKEAERSVDRGGD